jgi:NADH dehydrogenase
VIGRAAAVADLGRLRFSGYFAWLMWLFIQWAHSYFTRKRGARLITE